MWEKSESLTQACDQGSACCRGQRGCRHVPQRAERCPGSHPAAAAAAAPWAAAGCVHRVGVHGSPPQNGASVFVTVAGFKRRSWGWWGPGKRDWWVQETHSDADQELRRMEAVCV